MPIKLSVATHSGVPTYKSLIVSRPKSSGMLANSEASKETSHSFGFTVIFFITSKNCAELSIEYGELVVRGLRKSCSHLRGCDRASRSGRQSYVEGNHLCALLARRTHER